MPAITQPRPQLPFTGRRYGQFGKSPFPDFMRGSLSIQPHVVGEIKIGTHVYGQVTMEPSLCGKVEINP